MSVSQYIDFFDDLGRRMQTVCAHSGHDRELECFLCSVWAYQLMQRGNAACILGIADDDFNRILCIGLI